MSIDLLQVSVRKSNFMSCVKSMNSFNIIYKRHNNFHVMFSPNHTEIKTIKSFIFHLGLIKVYIFAMAIISRKKNTFLFSQQYYFYMFVIYLGKISSSSPSVCYIYVAYMLHHIKQFIIFNDCILFFLLCCFYFI